MAKAVRREFVSERRRHTARHPRVKPEGDGWGETVIELALLGPQVKGVRLRLGQSMRLEHRFRGRRLRPGHCR